MQRPIKAASRISFPGMGLPAVMQSGAAACVCMSEWRGVFRSQGGRHAAAQPGEV